MDHDAWPGGAVVKVRIGLHTGDGRLTPGGREYAGVDVHYAARLAAAGNGGQVVLSETTRRALGDGPPHVGPDGVEIRSLGPRRLKDFDEPRLIHRLVLPGSLDGDR